MCLEKILLRSLKSLRSRIRILIQRLSSPDLELLNFIQRFKSVEFRIYSMRDPVTRTTLIAPTSVQLRAMRRDLLSRKNYFYNVDSFLTKTCCRVIIDIGANIGYYTRACSYHSRGREVIAFEPSLKNLAFCAMNLRDVPNVTLVHCGLANAPGRFEVALPDYAKSRKGEAKFNTGLFSAIGNTSDQGTRFVSLDSFLSFFSIPAADIGWVKIDVEGFELNVLRGMSDFLSKSSAAIEVEINQTALARAEVNTSDLFALFDEHGYLPLKSDASFGIDNDLTPRVLDLVFVKREWCNLAKVQLDLEELTEIDINRLT